MRQFLAIAFNAFMELVRQPVYLLLLTSSAIFEVFLSCVQYFGFGDEPKLVKNSVLAIMFFSGLLGSVLTASSSVAREIRSGTALTVLSKPVGRAKFLLAKYAGVAAAILVMTYTNLLAALLASRMAFDAYGGVELPALLVFSGSIASAYLIAAFSNFFLRRPFMSDAVLSVVIMETLGFVLINYIKKTSFFPDANIAIDWRVLPSGILILFALWILAAIAIACSTRFDTVPTLAVCSAFFLVGLMSDYLFGRPAAAGSWWATLLYTITPNWQLFWMGDVINGDNGVPWRYVALAFTYVLGYAGAALALGLALFEDRELS
jgi:ABC-type transport system involved in multi-copper enzyme maturation permease subunit